MTTLKTAQEKAEEMIDEYHKNYVYESNDEVYRKRIDEIVATIYTDLLDSIEEKGGDLMKDCGNCNACEQMMSCDYASGYNTAHRKFFSVIKEHRGSIKSDK